MLPLHLHMCVAQGTARATFILASEGGREENARKSAQVVELGSHLLLHKASRLGDECEVCSD